MQKLLYKTTPLAVMTACVIWCCWSQLREATPLLAATAAKLPRIQRKLLDPDMSPLGERDPFLQYKPEPAPTATEDSVGAQEVVPEEPPFDPQSLLPSLRLDATILGARRLAVISGKIHGEGERILVEQVPDVQVRLVHVHRDEVVVTIEEEAFRITYTHKVREAVPPVSTPEAVPRSTDEFGDDLPEGTPSPDELDQAVAASLANPPFLTDDEDDSHEAGKIRASAGHEVEDGEFDKVQLITDKIQKWLNNE